MILLLRTWPLALTVSLGVAACNEPPVPARYAVVDPSRTNPEQRTSSSIPTTAAADPVAASPLRKAVVPPSSAPAAYDQQLLLNDHPLTPGSDYRLLRPGDNATFTAAVAFVGYGISQPGYDDYDGIDVRGKVVLALRDTPPNLHRSTDGVADTQTRTAAAHGALAILLVSQTLSEPDGKSPLQPALIPAFAVTGRVGNLLLTTAGQPSLDDFTAAINALGRPKSTALPRVIVSGWVQRR